MQEKYGFFGGSFNPVTNAHLNIAKLVQEKYKLDKVVFVPMGDHYPKLELAKEEHRYEMLKIATNKEDKLEVSDIELNLPNSLTMLQAFEKIQKRYIGIKAYFIIGADNLNKLVSLGDFEILAGNYEFIVIGRNSINIQEKISLNPILERFKTHFNILEDNPYENMSATSVRNALKSGSNSDISNIIPREVEEYIRKNNIY